jgi:hypothetical protein
LLQTNDFALKTSATPTIFADRILRVQREDRILRLIDRLKLVVARRNERSETQWNFIQTTKRRIGACSDKASLGR